MPLRAVGERAHQHRQVDAGDALRRGRASAACRRGCTASRRRCRRRPATPSPVSSRVDHRRARPAAAASGSSVAATDSISNCGGRAPSTCVTALTRLSPQRVVRDDEDADHVDAPDGGGRRHPKMLARGAARGQPRLRTAAGASPQTVAVGLQRERLTAAGPLEQRVGEHPADVEAGLLGDLDEARRARDVDLGQAAADDVEADDEQALGPQRGGPAPRRSRGRAR